MEIFVLLQMKMSWLSEVCDSKQFIEEESHNANFIEISSIGDRSDAQNYYAQM